MPIVNFSVPKTLDKRVAKTMAEKGFASKAEFFRFAAIHFMDVVNKPFVSEDKRFDYLTKEISHKLRERYRGQKIPALEEQLSDI